MEGDTWYVLLPMVAKGLTQNENLDLLNLFFHFTWAVEPPGVYNMNCNTNDKCNANSGTL